jgi:hypothetical protein|nr:hypothetical protein [uncultured bacterium]|tara:strand:- start:88 stop:312 length:225 start_codon:yes stop_codon:yes gene_type:complete
MCTEETLIDIESICIEIFEPILGVIELRTIIVLGFELERGYSACTLKDNLSSRVSKRVECLVSLKQYRNPTQNE